MTVNVNDKVNELNAAQRKKAEARAKTLIAAEERARKLRRARKIHPRLSGIDRLPSA